jgi:hypothetical protein
MSVVLHLVAATIIVLALFLLLKDHRLIRFSPRLRPVPLERTSFPASFGTDVKIPRDLEPQHTAM